MFFLAWSARNMKKMGGKMKLRQVMVEAPMRSRMEEKSGREMPSTSRVATTPVLNNILRGPNSDIRL